MESLRHRRGRRAAIGRLRAVGLGLVLAVGTSVAPRVADVAAPAAADVAAPAVADAATIPTFAHLIGQKLIVRMDGTTPSASLLGRIRRGEIGGVILFGANIVDAAQVKALTARLHAAAAVGRQPRFLVAVDQEGGRIKRIPWAPPTLSPPQMGALASTSLARNQGLLTGQALKALGIDVDLAPVADVPFSTRSFLYQQGRTWSFNASRTEWLSWSFADGLRKGGVIPAMKHFPGLGYATLNTDRYVVTIRRSVRELTPGLLPYKLAISHAIPLVMLSNATYPAWDASHPAGWSSTINTTLLRTRLGFKGVTMTDSLDGTAAARGTTTATLALRAAQAGTDMLLLTGSEASSARVFTTLLGAARSGQLSMSRLKASWSRILALKAAR